MHRLPHRHGQLFCAWLFFVLASVAGAQNFVNPVQIPISADPVTLTAGDLNGDGLPDLIWGEYYGYGSGYLHILLAQKGGGYLPAPTLTTAAGFPPVCRLADTNRDSKPDLVCIGPNGPNVYLGKGDGTFSAVVLNSALFISSVNQISVPFDLNGDGIPDFVVSDTQQSYVLLGTGSGTFTLAQRLPQTALPIAAKDVNGDGMPDLLYLGPAVALGKGGGLFGPFTGYSAPPPPNRYLGVDTCVFADIDRDGHLDSVCAETVLADKVDITGLVQLVVQHGNADGSFNTQPLLTQTYGDTTNFYNGTPTFSGLFALQDVNGDGVPDLLEFNRDGLGVLLGQSGPAFAYPLHFGVGNGRPNTVSPYVFQDMNGDGVADFVSTGPQSIVITSGKADGSFATIPDLEAAKYLTSAVLADFNGDGVPDVVTAGDTSLELNLGKGDGTFLPFSPISTPGISFTSTGATGSGVFSIRALFQGDFNGDRKRDLFAIGLLNQQTTASLVLSGNGDGTFQSPVISSLPSLSALSQVVDLNGDGRDDLLSFTPLGTYSGSNAPQLQVLLSKGDGTFRQVLSPAAAEPYSSFFLTICQPQAADLEHNGKLDVAYATVNNLYIARGHGDGSFDAPVTRIPLPVLSGYQNATVQGIAIGDFDGDGLLDIALSVDLGSPSSSGTYFSYSSTVFIFYGTGGVTFGPGVSIGVFPRTSGQLLTGDFRNEGRPELAIFWSGNTYIDALNLFHITAIRGVDPPLSLITNVYPSMLLAGDLNRDGLLDLLVVNSGSNTVDPILNLGTTPFVTGSLDIAPEPSAVGQSFTLTATLVPPGASAPILAGNVSFSVDGFAVGSATLTSNTATLVLPGTLAAGSHQVTAVWPGDSTYAAVPLSRIHMVTALSTAETLTAAPNPSTAGQPVTFVATLTGPAGQTAAPTGTVTFLDGAGTLGSALVMTSNGQSSASFVSQTLAIGSHTIAAIYGGDTTFGTASAALVQVVTGLPDSANLVASPDPATVFQPVTLLFTLSGLVAGTRPNGHVVFLDNGAVLGDVPLSSSGTATFGVAFNSAGAHALTATFAGDSYYQPVGASAVEQVQTLSTSLSITSSLNPSVAQQPVTFTVTLASGHPTAYSRQVSLYDGSVLLSVLNVSSAGAASFTTATLAPGTHSISATFGGVSQVFEPSSAPALTQLVNLSLSATSLVVTPDPALQGQVVTLKAVVTTPLGLRTTGSVTFSDGATSLGSAIAVNGVATLSTAQLTVGDHRLTAFYSGDTNTLPSASSIAIETVLPSDFALTSLPASLTLATGHHLTFALSASSIGAFTDQLQLTSDALSAHVTLLPKSSSVFLPQMSSASYSIYLDTDDVLGYLSQGEGHGEVPNRSLLPPALPVFCCLLGGAILWSFAGRRRRIHRFRLVAIVLSVWMAFSAAGCSGKYPASTPPGSYVLRLTVTGQGTHISHTLSVPLNVTK